MHRFEIDPTSLHREQPVTLPGPGGALEGLWRPVGRGRPPRGAVVVAHPLPTHGGTMLNKVVFHTARVLHHDHDLASLRFNFRGVGRSEGVYDDGKGEIDDLLAAWDWARRRVGTGVLVAAGFSFGGAISILAAAKAVSRKDPLPDALGVIGLPLARFAFPRPFPAPLPLAAVHGELDAFTPPDAVGEYLESWPAVCAFRVLPGADHFLEGALVPGIRFLSQSLGEWL